MADLTSEAGVAAAAEAAVTDMTSLLALHHLGLLPLFKARFARVVISQESLDELNQVIAARFSGKKPAGMLRPLARGIVTCDVSDEAFERDKAEFEAFREYIVENCEVVPCESRLGLPSEEYDKLHDVLGGSSLTTVLVASEQGMPMCCEDASLRKLAQSTWNVSSFWSQSILQDLRNRGLVGKDEYSKAVCSLILLRYRFVPLQADDLMWGLEENGMSATRDVLALLENLSGPDCSEESAALVAAEVIQNLWTRQVPFGQRMLLLDSICMALMRGRSRARVASILEQQLRRRFAGMPQALTPILATLEYWLHRTPVRPANIQLLDFFGQGRRNPSLP
jgi:hypothetical protein